MPLNIHNEQLIVEEIVLDFGTAFISLPRKQHYFFPFLNLLSGSLSKSV